jgi:hypothetical protein
MRNLEKNTFFRFFLKETAKNKSLVPIDQTKTRIGNLKENKI